MEPTDVEPFMNQLSRCRVVLLAVMVGLAGCGSTASEVDIGASAPTRTPVVQVDAEATDVLDGEDADPFDPLRTFMEENAANDPLFRRIDLIPALDNGRRIIAAVFEQPDGSDAYVLTFAYKPSCSHVPGVLTSTESGDFVWTVGRPEAGGIDHDSIDCPPDWQFGPTLDGRPTLLEISVDEYEAAALTLTIGGSTERWTMTTVGG